MSLPSLQGMMQSNKGAVALQILLTSQYQQGVQRSLDGGLTFSTLTMPIVPTQGWWGASSMSHDAHYQILPAGNNGCYLSSDYGASWAIIPNTLWNGYNRSFISPNAAVMVVYGANYNSKISFNFGVTWADTTYNSTALRYFWCDETYTEIIKFQANGSFDYSLNGGATWGLSSIPTSGGVVCVTGQKNDGYCVTYSCQQNVYINAFYHASAYTQQIGVNYNYMPYGVQWDFVNDFLYASHMNGIIKMSLVGNVTTLITTGTSPSIPNNIGVTNDSQIIFATLRDQTLVVSHDAGATWLTIAQAMATSYTFMSMQKIY